MRDARLQLGLLLVAAAVPLACGQAFQLSGSTTTSTGVGGEAATASVGGSGGGAVASSGGGSGAVTVTATSTTTSTGSGGKTCTTAADCPGTNTLCGDYVCMEGHCALHQLQGDGPSVSQLYGDCRTAKCKQAKLLFEGASDDFYDDGNPCTQDTCEGGASMNKILVGSSCGVSGVCNAKGACVECLGNGNCNDPTPTCVNSYCAVGACQNQVPDVGETDIDCGGPICGPCIAGQVCKVASDCASKICEDAFSGALFKNCKLPTCSDGVQNSTETDQDCGGMNCPGSSKCDDGKHCALPTDCKSGVCQTGTCHPATCTDGVKNGAETGIDCGAAGCVLSKCPGT